MIKNVNGRELSDRVSVTQSRNLVSYP